MKDDLEWAKCDMSGIEQELREHAYHFWEKAGRPEGRDLEFWCMAEREMFGYTVGEMSQAYDDLADVANDKDLTAYAAWYSEAYLLPQRP